MTIPELFARSVAEFDSRVQQVKDDQWHDPTPCSEWDVHALTNHIVNEARWVKPLLEGKTIEEVGDSLDGDLLGDNPKASWGRAKEEELAALQALGDLDQEVHVSWGEIPAREYLMQVLVDHTVHAWDLARAIGADEKLDPALVDASYEMAVAAEPMLRQSGAYGDKVETPSDADLQTKLLAIMGRSV